MRRHSSPTRRSSDLNLDGENEAEIIALLQELAHKDNKCVIIVSHSKVIKECVDELIYLEKGSIKGM